MEKYSSVYRSPIGTILIGGSDETVQTISFVETQDIIINGSNKLIDECCAQLDRYFGGELRQFDFPMAQTGTPFQKKVWDLLVGIPFGKTVSYNDLAKQYGDVKAIRAVASANGRNMLAIVVPCHRVIGSNGSLTGYAAGIHRKRWLLAHEARYFGGVQSLGF